MAHQWALSWPGNYCTRCGIDDPLEEALAFDDILECDPESGNPIKFGHWTEMWINYVLNLECPRKPNG